MLAMILIPGVKAKSLLGNSFNSTVLSRFLLPPYWTGNSSAPEVIEMVGVLMIALILLALLNLLEL
jgi:hypothetical protein